MGQDQDNTCTQIKVVPIRGIVLETERSTILILGKSKLYSPLLVLKFVHIFQRSLGNQNSKAGADRDRSVHPEGTRQRVLALALINEFKSGVAAFTKAVNFSAPVI